MNTTKARLGAVTVDAGPKAEKSDYAFAMKLAGGWARRFPRGSFIRDEILSAGHLGYALALRDYTGRGEWRHYLSSKVVGEVRHALDKDWRTPGGMREFGKTGWKGRAQRGTAIFLELDPYDNGGSLGHTHPSPENKVVEFHAFRQAIATMPERWAQVLEAKLIHDKDQNEIARELGVSSPRVHQILNKGLKALREYYEEEAA